VPSQSLRITLIVLSSFAMISHAAAAAPLDKRQEVSQYGITWTFAEPAAVGTFVNGDWFVVGPVTIAKITPAPAAGRNGSVLNLPVTGLAGFDDRTPGRRYDASQAVSLPVQMRPGDALISTISVEKAGTLPRMLRPSDKAISPVKTAAVLTCLAQRPPAVAFRPAYCDRGQTIYRASDLRRDLLPRLARVPAAESPAKWERVFQRVWIDTVFDGFACPVDNMPQYGREIARATSIATLLLCCDFTPREKEKLLINVVQVGIDLWGIARAGHPGWPAHGGHGNGRKWAIVFAGLMLDDAAMQRPMKYYPSLKLSEDMQTMYGRSWTGANVVYAGHVGAEGLSGKTGWGLYENLPPEQWPARIGESYRRCCTSVAWVGTALAIRILHAEDAWGHDAFLDYSDRWMTEDDTEHIRRIKEAKGWDFSAEWNRQGQAWDPFVNEMYKTYRHKLPAPTTRPARE